MNDVVAATERMTHDERGEACVENPAIPKSYRNIVRKQIVDFVTELGQRGSEPQHEFGRAQRGIARMGDGQQHAQRPEGRCGLVHRGAVPREHRGDFRQTFARRASLSMRVSGSEPALKVLHVVWYSDLGGIENYTRNLFTELETRGHSNALVVAGVLLDGLQTEGRGVYLLPAIVDQSPAASAGLIHDLGEILDREEPDVAYLHTAMNRAASALLLQRLPTVFFAHNYAAFCPAGTLYYRHTNATCEFDTAPNWGCLMNAYLQGCNTRRPQQLLASYQLAQQTESWTRLTDAMVCDSEYVKERHVRAGFTPERIHVLPSPVLIPPAPSPPPALRDTFLFCGRLVQNKGLETLIDAVPMTAATTRLLIAGDGSLRRSLVARAAKLGVSNRVEFLGRLPESELSALYARATVVVVPSEWPEPLGMVGPEALAHGRPVVGTAAGGSSEWLKSDVTGLIVPTRDAAALAKAVNRLISDVDLAARLGAAGRRLVEERFSLASHAQRLVSVFEVARTHYRNHGARP